MIKKIYAILCAISLFFALPAFGMENEDNISDQENTTYQCDFCNKSEPPFRVLNAHGWYIKCHHILCEVCLDAVSFHFNRSKGEFSNKVWWGCHCCSYFHYHQKSIRLQKTEDKGSRPFFPVGTLLNNKDLKDLINEQNVPNPTNEIPDKPKLLKLLEPNTFIIAGFICYGAYKAYNWWKGKDEQGNEQEDGNESEQENLKKEAKPIEVA